MIGNVVKHDRTVSQPSCWLVSLACLIGVLSFTIAAGRAHAGQHGIQINAGDIESIRLVSWRRYYGRPVYRCRRFSSRCYYRRPAAYYAHYSSVGYQFYGHRSGHQTPPVRLGRYFVNPAAVASRNSSEPWETGARASGAQKTTVLERTGGFVRITAPGHVTRWVRADILESGEGSKE